MEDTDIEAAFQGDGSTSRTALSSISSYIFRSTNEEDHHHRLDENTPVISVPLLQKDSIRSMGSFDSYETFDTTEPTRSIRFQVVIWYVGRPDEVLGKVEMKFRVTIFWKAPNEKDDEVGYGMNNPHITKVWKMHGRQRAYHTELSEAGKQDKIVYVPPVSILNAVDHEILGEPEVCLVNAKNNSMKWTCLYKASLLQENLRVAQFPHDSHDLVLRLGILKHRQRRKVSFW